MMRKILLLYLLIIAVGILTLVSCNTHKGLVFANRDWHVNDDTGQIIDQDTIWRMTFGDRLIPEAMVIASSKDSIAKYPGMEKFISDILHTACLDSAEILLYAPYMWSMFVKPKGATLHSRPSSISVNLSDERPYTMWVYADDMEDWIRKPSEMYTYTYLDKRKKRLLIVDFYNYGDEPIAQIFIFQSFTKATRKMGIPYAFNHAFFKHNIGELEEDIEFWAHIIDGHRKLAFANYKLGQEQKLIKR